MVCMYVYIYIYIILYSAVVCNIKKSHDAQLNFMVHRKIHATLLQLFIYCTC